MVFKREDLQDAVVRALGSFPDKRGRVVEVAKHIWAHHEQHLRDAGDLFYTWHYDMRWAAQRLRDAGKLTYTRFDGHPAWQLLGAG